jgi:hypothetical protein
MAWRAPGRNPCTFKWSDGRTVETIRAPPIIQHRSSKVN